MHQPLIEKSDQCQKPDSSGVVEDINTLAKSISERGVEDNKGQRIKRKVGLAEGSAGGGVGGWGGGGEDPLKNSGVCVCTVVL